MNDPAYDPKTAIGRYVDPGEEIAASAKMEANQLRELLYRAEEKQNAMTARAARLASLLARYLLIMDTQHPLAMETREAFRAGSVDNDASAAYAFASAADEVAGALQNLLNGIRSDLVTVDAIADETWANAMQRCDRALEAYRNGGRK